MVGIVVVDKPSGWTSHDVVAKLRGVFKLKRIGHGGTLDPMATGVLPVFVGRATRAAEFCENADKEYVAGIKLGVVTDTQDTTGNVISVCGHGVSAEDISKTIPMFLYSQKQVPPMYSAVKIGGKKLYEIARRGETVERAARDVFISELELLPGGCDSQFVNHNSQIEADEYLLRIVCSKGTYVRTLCHDIGAALGCGAAMSYLRRTRAGAFSLSMAHTLDEIIDAVSSGDLDRVVLPLDMIFSDLPAITLDDAGMRKCLNGAAYHVDARIEDGSRHRVYAPDGGFLALGEAGNGEIRTVKSFF